MRKRHIKYDEGQWFAVPLRNGGYAVGIIVRGTYETKGGLGYFFGPRYRDVPDDAATWTKHAPDAILVAWFGDLGIIEGRWPLISSSRPFHRGEWPVPKFARIDLINPSKGWLVEYDQEDDGLGRPIRETVCPAQDLVGIPEDVLSGAGAVEIKLTKLLSER